MSSYATVLKGVQYAFSKHSASVSLRGLVGSAASNKQVVALSVLRLYVRALSDYNPEECSSSTLQEADIADMLAYVSSTTGETIQYP